MSCSRFRCPLLVVSHWYVCGVGGAGGACFLCVLYSFHASVSLVVLYSSLLENGHDTLTNNPEQIRCTFVAYFAVMHVLVAYFAVSHVLVACFAVFHVFGICNVDWLPGFLFGLQMWLAWLFVCLATVSVEIHTIHFRDQSLLSCRRFCWSQGEQLPLHPFFHIS